MKYRFELLKDEDFNQIETVASLAEIDEAIDYDCKFLVGRNGDNSILGFAGVNLYPRKYPQFEHIVLHPKVKGSKLGYLLMMEMEKFLREKGYKVYVAYILNTRNWMQELALKFGFSPYANDPDGVWMWKSVERKF